MILVGFKTEVLDGLKLLQKAFDLSKIIFETTSLSSLASEFQEGSSEKQNKLTIVLKGTTSLSPAEFIHKLKYFEKLIHERFPQRYFSAWLLSFEEQVILSPELVLPHPRLALDSTILHLSTEIYAHYTHPILNVKLEELSKKLRVKNFEFRAQGRALLSKSAKDIEQC
jgi:7,8-dihydro-6-hydroxymethylpterin-pyrophosphokinase